MADWSIMKKPYTSKLYMSLDFGHASSYRFGGHKIYISVKWIEAWIRIDEQIGIQVGPISRLGSISGSMNQIMDRGSDRDYGEKGFLRRSASFDGRPDHRIRCR